MNKKFIWGMLFLLTSSTLYAEIKLPLILTDHMVLQQQTQVNLWGKATADKKVSITTSWDKKTYTVRSDMAGKWKVKVNTPIAGGPYSIAISDGKEVRLNDILIGEVWVCSGQSNMEMTLRGYRKGNNHENDILSANYPQIRLLHIDKAMSSRSLDDFKKTRGGWKECSSTTVPEFSAVAYYFGRNLYENLNVPIGLISTAFGGTVAEAWTSGEMLDNVPDFVESLRKLRNTQDTAKIYTENPNRPTVLYNAMIYPMTQYAIQGVIWYQGESNCMRAYQYKDLFPLLIADWRKKWERNLPFYYVQLANFGKRHDEPEEAPWAELREAQLKTLSVENTGMAVSIDIGEADDVHPINKQDVGLRLALAARANTYGERISFSGPLYESYRLDGNTIRIMFKYTDNGLLAKDEKELKGFTIAGSDHKFYHAKAIIDGNSILVNSPNVPIPLAVRYAWAANPECNLINGSGLPASPFRTDDWRMNEIR